MVYLIALFLNYKLWSSKVAPYLSIQTKYIDVVRKSFRLIMRFLKIFIASDTKNTVDERAVRNIMSPRDKASVWKILWNGGQ